MTDSQELRDELRDTIRKAVLLPEPDMSREIKFRAWDKEKNHWLSTWASGYAAIEPNPQYEVMQFTGLLDKNGKEIYEGDIVGYRDPRFGEAAGSSKYHRKFVVEFKEAMFNVSSISVNHGAEVVGNIWENGDLLK